MEAWGRHTPSKGRGKGLELAGKCGDPDVLRPETQATVRGGLRTIKRHDGCHQKAAVLLGLLLAIFPACNPVFAAESNAAGLAVSKAKDLFPTTNDTLFVEDLESSRIAQTFAENVATPIKSLVPRSYSATFVRAQMSVRVSGLFSMLSRTSCFENDFCSVA